jgi:hypothetical protein
MPEFISSAGYFTWLQFLPDRSSSEVEGRLGYRPGALSDGWLLLSPRHPLEAGNIDLRGSTRIEDGRLPDGRLIRDVLGARTDLAAAQRKLAAFFDRGLERRPAKVWPILERERIGYEPARTGIPQFRLFRPVEWAILARVPAGGVLSRAMITI